MIDNISRQAALDAINHICPVDTEYDCTLLDRVDVRYVLSDLPSTDRKGHWITDKYGNILCSECGWCAPQIVTGCLADRHLDYTKSNFCWHCGADMRG